MTATSDPVAAPGAPAADPRPGLRRSRRHRLVAGVAGGLAARLGVDPVVTRAAFVVLTFAGGVGLVLYGLAWGTLPPDDDDDPVADPAESRQRIAMGLVLLGVLLGLRALGVWFVDEIVSPVALVAFGFALLWERVDPGERTRWTRFALPAQDETGPPAPWRLIAGVVLMVAGVSAFFGTVSAFDQFGTVLLAISVTTAGFVLVFGPWMWRMAGDLATERRERIRSEERADMAAHLHDSVLQTLALIQRSDDPKRMVTLARAQERELRSWLYGSGDPGEPRRLEGALRAAADRVERDHDIPVDVVVVGDCPVTDDIGALVLASAEAMSNAACHSGAGSVSVYGEVGDDRVEVWIADQGRGFDPATVSGDRHGIRESIVGRMERHGGKAAISADADGTEVHLAMDRRPG